jgi:hypothetical protein
LTPDDLLFLKHVWEVLGVEEDAKAGQREVWARRQRECRARHREEDMKQRTCEWEGCEADITWTHNRTRYCVEHKRPAYEKATRENKQRQKEKKQPPMKVGEDFEKKVDPRPAPEDYRPPIADRRVSLTIGDIIGMVADTRVLETDRECRAYVAGYIKGSEA